MSYYDPYDLVVGIVADALEKACITDVLATDSSRVDAVYRYDYSGNPTRIGTSARHITVSPDATIGANRGDYPISWAIGHGPRLWDFHAVVTINAFLDKVTRNKESVRDIVSKIAGRSRVAMGQLATTATGSTADGHWRVIKPSERYIQGAGQAVRDAGPNRGLEGEQSFVVGFVLQYIP